MRGVTYSRRSASPTRRTASAACASMRSDIATQEMLSVRRGEAVWRCRLCNEVGHITVAVGPTVGWCGSQSEEQRSKSCDTACPATIESPSRERSAATMLATLAEHRRQQECERWASAVRRLCVPVPVCPWLCKQHRDFLIVNNNNNNLLWLWLYSRP